VRCFLEAQIHQSDWSEANLAGAVLQKVQVGDSTFERAQATRAVWTQSVLHNVSFAGADLSLADFSHARLTRVDFKKARLESSRLHNAVLDEVAISRRSRWRTVGTDQKLLDAERNVLAAGVM